VLYVIKKKVCGKRAIKRSYLTTNSVLKKKRTRSAAGRGETRGSAPGGARVPGGEKEERDWRIGRQECRGTSLILTGIRKKSWRKEGSKKRQVTGIGGTRKGGVKLKGGT